MTVHILSDARSRRARPEFEDTRFAPPEDPQIKTGIDKATALMAWAVGPILTIAIIAGLAWLAGYFFH